MCICFKINCYPELILTIVPCAKPFSLMPVSDVSCCCGDMWCQTFFLTNFRFSAENDHADEPKMLLSYPPSPTVPASCLLTTTLGLD